MTDMQLTQLASDWRGDVPEGGAMIEEKVDGWRAIWIPDWRGEWRLYSRNGHRIEGIGHIAYRLAEMSRAAGEPMVFDGEFQEGGSLAATKAWCERGWKAGGEAGQFHAFDCQTLAEWRAGGSDVPLASRKNRLADLASVVVDDWTWRPGSKGRDDAAPPVVVLSDAWAFNAHDVVAEAQRVWAAGGEGVMLKAADSPYRRQRTDAWQKVKHENARHWARIAA